jgi:sarcosine dehydrogenase
MPRKIAVIGGGVVGCSVDWHLAERSLGDVLLIERDRLGSGTTWHSAGNLTWRPGGRFDAAVLYAFETIPRLTRETGQETGWLKTGRLRSPSAGWKPIKRTPPAAASNPG